MNRRQQNGGIKKVKKISLYCYYYYPACQHSSQYNQILQTWKTL